MTPELEEKRAALENAMAHIVRASKHLELVTLRVENASKRGMSSVLDPALIDLQEARKRLNKAQSELSKIWNESLWKI
jgi:exonuclease VII small subunit